MKAQILDHTAKIEKHPLTLQDVEIPTYNENEILIKVHVCGICRTDLHVIEGELESKKLPLIPGHQVVGSIIAIGKKVKDFVLDDRVGIAWLQRTCGKCRFCTTGRENLCEEAIFTGWSTNGGFAEYIVAPAQFAYSLPQGYPDLKAAPLLCAGIIGYRSLKLMEISDWKYKKIGIYGFGAAGHIAIQLLRARGAEVYVCTRDEKHQKLAAALGAKWVGGTIDPPPQLLEAAVVFAPAGEIVPAALKALDRDGRLILAGIHMSPIPSFSYDVLYGERRIKSVTNNTRQDGQEFLLEAARIGIEMHIEQFPLSQANEALYKLKHDQFQGAGVLVVD